MNLLSLFKKTLGSLKQSTKKFWFICFVFALISTMSTILNINSSINEETSIGQDIEYEYYDDEYTMDDFLITNDIDEKDSLDLNEILPDFKVSSELLKLLPFVVVGGFILIIIMISVATIINYYFIGFAIESVKKCNLSKGKNIINAILAELLFVLIVAIPVLIGVLGVVLGVNLSNSMLSIGSGTLGIILFIWLCIKYCPIYFVAVKYQKLSFKEILFKASDMTKNNILKILGYTFVCGFVTNFIIKCIESLAVTFMCIPDLGIIVYGILVVITTTISIAFNCLFNVNMFEALDS